MQALYDHLKQHPIVYITRDIERALGLPLDTTGYSIISNKTDLVKLPEDRTHIVLIDSDRPLDTWQLLKHQETRNKIQTISNIQYPISVLVFKNTVQIERICAEQGWKLLNPSAGLSNRVEEKVSQVEWLGELAKYLPPHAVGACKDIAWNGEPFVLQFNRSHTGIGTFLIESGEQLEKLIQKIPNRPVRTLEYVDGPIFTVNTVVTSAGILVGNISYQITGLAPFTRNRFATIGNDWGFANKLLKDKQKEQIRRIATDIGEKLRTDGWKGLFGIDIILEEKTGGLYLIEVNARQPASVVYESQLQKKSEIKNLKSEISTFEAHLASILDLDLSYHSLIPIANGSQVFDRKNNKVYRFDHSVITEHGKIAHRFP
ncbi:MAG: hypothetical protein A3C90_01700 [Candidatus Magasanikbacteria bacterium RIFCSPHIGHO2_02_FULL_51_14]|uniref:ATP-grasp domain-containing protein n=1 Tax=Candidatus Magasanikbacteria bacterium RIFCSPHIGHO2_02_FULL_51_14 TaxID=1798683 RepID=A0A1F6MQ19_9BACT|nr:MAG: hypothetical protein A3C90_01700 [Candidatus Magasanikbacteria bacterium RIFCSPHIGHO2_02_FULL_51_14]